MSKTPYQYINLVGKNLKSGIDQLKETKVNKYYSEVNIQDYATYRNGNDWANAISEAITDIEEGGILTFPAGQFYTSKLFPTSKKITIQGAGYEKTILQYTGSASTGAFLDIRVSGFCIKDIGIYGNYNSNTTQTCDGIWIREMEDGTATGGQQIFNVMVRYFGGNGIYIYAKVWMVLFDKIRCYHNKQCGMLVTGTDNTFSNMQFEGNGQYGLKVTGGNNRISNVNCIYNGKDSEDGAAGYFSAWHLSLSNVVCQDEYHNGFIFEGCSYSTIDVIADAGGQAYNTGLESEITSYGIIIRNGCNHLIGSMLAVNYRLKITQLRGLFEDGTSYNINIKYDENPTYLYKPLIQSTMAVNISTPGKILYDKYTKTDSTLHNKIVSPDFSSASGYVKYGTTTMTVTDGIASLSIDGSSGKFRMFSIKDTKEVQHVYYHSIKVKTTDPNISVVMFNNTDKTPSYYNLDKKTCINDGEWHTYSWIDYCGGTSTDFYLTVTYSSTDIALVDIKEPMCIDLTSDLGIVLSGYSDTAKSLETEWMDDLIEYVGGWFSGSVEIMNPNS